MTTAGRPPAKVDQGAVLQVMLDIDKVDDMTLTIHTGADGDPERPLPWRDFPHLLAGQWGLIASPRWLDAVADDPALATAPIGSGPFIVDSYEPYGSLEAHRNPDYWMTDADGQQLPYLDSISFRVIEDPQTSGEALDAGDIDLFATTNGLAITDAQARDDEVSVTVQDTFVDSYYLLIDLSKPGPLQDRRVRCAMSLAIDRDEFNDATSNGFDPSANGLFSPGEQGYLADNGLPMDQDLDTTRALIADRRIIGVWSRRGPGPQPLMPAECLELLGGCTVGRIAVVHEGYPVVFPVNFVLSRLDGAPVSVPSRRLPLVRRRVPRHHRAVGIGRARW